MTRPAAWELKRKAIQTCKTQRLESLSGCISSAQRPPMPPLWLEKLRPCGGTCYRTAPNLGTMAGESQRSQAPGKEKSAASQLGIVTSRMQMAWCGEGRRLFARRPRPHLSTMSRSRVFQFFFPLSSFPRLVSPWRCLISVSSISFLLNPPLFPHLSLSRPLKRVFMFMSQGKRLMLFLILFPQPRAKTMIRPW